jgi:S-adenosyl methyltransferase
MTGPGGVPPAGEIEAPEPPAIDVSRPNIARVYDCLLGGKDNYAADRAEAARLINVFPLLPLRARQNRLFLARAVTWLAGQEGIRQFIDIGCGLPAANNIHQIAQAVNPDCQVAYVDQDLVVVSHARALLSGPGMIALRGDLADPDAILADPALQQTITLAEPVAVILAMVLHFFEAATARGIAAAITRAIAPGSYVVISAGSGDEQTGGRLAREYQAATLYNHSPAQIGAFFDGLDLIPPGLTEARDWVPGPTAPLRARLSGGHILAGIGRKPTIG